MKIAFIGAILLAGATTPASLLTSQKDHHHVVDDILQEKLSEVQVFDHMEDALRVMQDEFFAPWIGTWPTSIDWTAAVMGTHVSAALGSLSRGLDLVWASSSARETRARENLVTLYFSQVLSYYFGQDHFSIRNEAYDDILWVVLGWLETIQFIDLHTDTYYPAGSKILGNQTWHGNLWTPPFAHRARVFWNLAKNGWDTKLCGGGMTWNPRLEPYKNAITNELFIAASASMYLYFPGDDNTSPFSTDDIAYRPHNPAYLAFAEDGYSWLASSHMTNTHGLYIDGFHISGYKTPGNTNTKCDVRNEQVYTYNQGVLLTGQIGLWKTTGNKTYLQDGHRLIHSVIRATGWDLKKNRPMDKISTGQLPPWRGLGRAGVLEEVCDVTGTCSQDSQTFKGIFFHHLAAFCAPSDVAAAAAADSAIVEGKSHKHACREYVEWMKHNARAALASRDASGRFGMWWTLGLLDITSVPDDVDNGQQSGPGAVDYRNDGVPDDDVWRSRGPRVPLAPQKPIGTFIDDSEWQVLTGSPHELRSTAGRPRQGEAVRGEAETQDLNDRERGRTVETQGSGLALVRALWELSTRC